MKTLLSCLVWLVLLGSVFSQELEPLKYNNPGLNVDLGVGLWAWPLPMDFDQDGDLDLVVNCSDKPSNGIYFFENVSGDTAKNPMPVFKAGKKISRGLQNVQVSFVNEKPIVTSPGKTYPDFIHSGLSAGEKLPISEKVHPGKTRGNMWRVVDYDGDGIQDIIIGVGYWGDYGWDNAYDINGNWTNGPLRGFVYLAKNVGTNDNPQYDKPKKLLASNKPIEVFGWPSPNFADFDKDGDLDLICGEFLDGFNWFKNEGTRTKPRYASGKPLATKNGMPLKMNLQMITPVAIDWNKDGNIDLVVGDEDGRVAFVENSGEQNLDGAPIFHQPKYFKQQANDLKFGALSTPIGFDWDNDGDEDILCGNTAGNICWFENLSNEDTKHPKWAAPNLLKVKNIPIRIMAGKNGSIQGPAEAKWGYTTLSVADWNGDQLPDLIVNSIWGKIIWYENIGTKKQPRLRAAQPIEVEWGGEQPKLAYGWLRPEGKGLLTQWRTTPVAVDWNQDGLMDLVVLDHEGYLALFEREIRDGKLIVKAPARVFSDEKGIPLRLNARTAGKSGRRKLCFTDWDGDGSLDIILNSDNASLLRQVGSKDGKWLFKDLGLMDKRKVSSHTTSPGVIDFDGNGIPDLLVGAEDGRIYYKQNSRTK